MKRQAIYGRKTKAVRIISRPGGEWQVQRLSGAGGWKDRDPWVDLHRPTSFEQATAQLIAVDQKEANQ